MYRIMVVDDEENMCFILKMLFEEEGYSVITFTNGEEALRLIDKGEVVDLIITDLKMQGIDGMGILDYLKKTERDIPLVMITAYGSIPDAVEAMKKGASDFITKPFNSDIILHIVKKIFRERNVQIENEILSDIFHEDNIIYMSGKMKKIIYMVKKFSSVSSPVLITGESGTGKELIAKSIHLKSGLHPFVKINCSSIPESLFESELFGYQRGAFTGATKDYKGKIRMAELGTLFLDEIGELPMHIQPKLLRLLEDGCFEPLGSNTTIKVNTRFICATNRDLENMINEGQFRKDLYYRINTLNIRVPSLRERKEDILPLMDYYLSKFSQETGKNIKISEAVKQAFVSYDWPGNVRELRNIVERVVVLANEGEEIKLMHLPREFSQSSGSRIFLEENKLETAEKSLILEELNKTGWNVTAAAKSLGISRSNLRYRIKKYKLKEW
ncbi:MAG: hypothetical protein DRP87_06765 [Spirochaetes bacterium]|nr:MAG: hypothetical protein DRP87_06765 [Spirochaetota bacterium]